MMIQHITRFENQASFQTVLQSTKTSGGTSAYQAIEDINQTRYDQMDKLFVYLVENAKKQQQVLTVLHHQ